MSHTLALSAEKYQQQIKKCKAEDDKLGCQDVAVVEMMGWIISLLPGKSVCWGRLLCPNCTEFKGRLLGPKKYENQKAENVRLCQGRLLPILGEGVGGSRVPAPAIYFSMEVGSPALLDCDNKGGGAFSLQSLRARSLTASESCEETAESRNPLFPPITLSLLRKMNAAPCESSLENILGAEVLFKTP